MRPILRIEIDGRITREVNALIEHQKHTWPMLKEGYAAFEAMVTKRIEVDGSDVIVQHNPKRIRSTAARVDKASVGARACFLCPESLPVEEKAIALWRRSDDPLQSFPDPRPPSVYRSPRPRAAADRRQCRDAFDARARSRRPTTLFCTTARGAARRLRTICIFRLARARDSRSKRCSQTSRRRRPIATICAMSAQEGFELFTLTNGGRTVVVFRGNRGGELAGWVYQTINELPREDLGQRADGEHHLHL